MNERIFVLAAAIAWLVLATAHAQAPASTAGFDEAISTSLSAHARGDYATARAYMERAHSLEPSARTLRGLGIIAFSEQRYASAVRFFDAALASSTKPLSAELRASTEDLRGQAFSHVAALRVDVEPQTDDISVDGARPEVGAGGTLLLSPGTHEVEVRAEGRAPHALRLDLKPGTHETLRVVLPEAPAARIVERKAPTPVKTTPLSPRKAVNHSPAMRRGALVLVSALALSGGTMWALARIRLNDLDERCDQKPGGGCSDELARRRYDERNIDGLRGGAIALLTTAGAITATVGAVELWRWRQAAKLEVGASPRHVALRLRF
jgi:hypothetical protein